MAADEEAPTRHACMDASWQVNAAGSPIRVPIDNPLRASARLPLDGPAGSFASRSPAHFLSDRDNAPRLRTRVPRNLPCTGALSHEPYLSSLLE